jgi:pyruvate formate lyase activating enzyme
MYSKKEILESFIGVVDLFIVDLKLMDEDEHKKYIGTSNDLIFSNFKFLIKKKQNLLIRIPLIPKITATEENIQAISKFVMDSAPETPVELINFNPLAENKYRLMGKEYAFLTEMKPYSEDELDRFYSIMEKEGVTFQRESVIS